MDLFGLRSWWNLKAFKCNNNLFDQRVRNKKCQQPENMLGRIFNALEITSKTRAIKLYESLEEYEEKKLLGYYHPGYIRWECLLDFNKFQEDLKSIGLSSMALTRLPTGQFYGAEPFEALHVFRQSDLQDFLNKPQNAEILRNEAWPTDAKAFVLKTATVIADKETQKELYDLIAFAYHDLRPEYRNQRLAL